MAFHRERNLTQGEVDKLSSLAENYQNTSYQQASFIKKLTYSR
jgi:hypothetical protein